MQPCRACFFWLLFTSHRFGLLRFCLPLARLIIREAISRRSSLCDDSTGGLDQKPDFDPNGSR